MLFRSGTSQTVLLLEDDSAKIPWTKPDDLKMDDALELLTSEEADADGIHRYEDFFYRYRGIRHYAFTDGRVKGLPHGGSRELLQSLFTIDDGSPNEGWDGEGFYSSDYRTPKLGNWFRMAIFVFLVLLPLPWVWLKRKGQDSSA